MGCPCLNAIFNPGDVIGIPEIANGKTINQHSWMINHNECDVFMTTKEYARFMWHIMKKSKSGSGIVEDMIRTSPCLATISEQTMYTIAHDIAKFKEYNDGELIMR